MANTNEIKIPEVMNQEVDTDELFTEVDRMFCEILTKMFTLLLDCTIEEHPMTGNHEIDATQTWPAIIEEYKKRVENFKGAYKDAVLP
jgi:hypothetical protein